MTARFLLAPHAPTSGLAHLGACLEVGRRLREHGHEVEIAYGGTRADVIEAEGLRLHRVPDVIPEREWHPAGWYASETSLLEHVDAHRSVIDSVAPDAVITSSGVAAQLACEVSGVPQLHLMHYIQTTPYGRRATVWGDRRRDVRKPRRALRVMRARVRRARGTPSGPRTHDVVRAVRPLLGLRADGDPARGGVRDTQVAITSAPFIDPAKALPPTWSYVGPLAWSAPAGAGAPIRRGDRPLVYVTQGSTGSADLLTTAVTELAGEDVDVLVTTGGLCDPGKLEELGPRIRAASLLPNRECLEAADAAVVHGGHLTFCQALAIGTPLVVTPYRIDQTARVNRVERLGVGVAVWPPARRDGAVRAAVRRVLDQPRFARRSAALADRLRLWDGSANAAQLAESLAGG